MRVSRREIGVRYCEHHTVHTVIRNAGGPYERLSTKANEGIRFARQPTTKDPILDRSLLEVSTGKQILFRAVHLTPA
jgi:hypothetical protein